MEHEGNNYTNCDWCFWYSHRRIIKGTGGLENKRTSGYYPIYYIIEDSQNTETSPRDLRRLSVTQTSVREFYTSLLTELRNFRILVWCLI